MFTACIDLLLEARCIRRACETNRETIQRQRAGRGRWTKKHEL
jgi:hypothetical protein